MKEKIKKIITLTTILILIIVAGGFWQCQKQKHISECKRECIYNAEDKAWHYGGFGRLYGREFPSLEECIDYCLLELKK